MEHAESVGTERQLADALAACQQENAHLRDAMETRGVIEMAKGVLVTVHACTPDEAWSALSHASQRHNVKVALLAQQLLKVTQGGQPVPQEPVRRALAELAHRHPRSLS